MVWSLIDKGYKLDAKVNPIGHKIVDTQLNLAGKSGEAIGKAIGWDWLEKHGQSVQENRAQGVQDAAVVAALYFGGPYVAAAAQGGGGAEAAGAVEGAGAAESAGGGWVSGESIGESAGGGGELTSGESLPSGEQTQSNKPDWQRQLRQNMPSQGKQEQPKADLNAARRQELMARAQSLREQIAELRQQIAIEDSNQSLQGASE